MSVRADVMRATGGFEPSLGRLEVGSAVSGTADETEFCIRAARLHPGGYWAYRPAALVQHVVSPQRGTWRHFVRRCRLEGAAKAVLTGLAGAGEGLRSEREYTRVVLPRALRRELSAALRGRPDALARAGTIVAGLAITAGTYMSGRIKRLRGDRRRGREPRRAR